MSTANFLTKEIGRIPVCCFNETRQVSYEYKLDERISVLELEKMLKSRESLPECDLEFSHTYKGTTSIVANKSVQIGKYKLGWKVFFNIIEKEKVSAQIFSWSSEFLNIREVAERGFQVVKESKKKFHEYKEVDQVLTSVVEKRTSALAGMKVKEEEEEEEQVEVNLETGEMTCSENYVEMEIRLDCPFGYIRNKDFRIAVAEKAGVPQIFKNMDNEKRGKMVVVWDQKKTTTTNLDIVLS